MDSLIKYVLSTENGKKYLHEKSIKYLWISGEGCYNKDVWTPLPNDIKGMIIQCAKNDVEYVTWCLLGKGMIKIALNHYIFKCIKYQYWTHNMLFKIYHTWGTKNKRTCTILSRTESAGITLQAYIEAVISNISLKNHFISNFLDMFDVNHECHPFYCNEDSYPTYSYNILHYLRPHLNQYQHKNIYVDEIYLKHGRKLALSTPTTTIENPTFSKEDIELDRKVLVERLNWLKKRESNHPLIEKYEFVLKEYF